MTRNHSEIRCDSLTKILLSYLESSKNHKKNNLIENFSQNSYVKPSAFQVLGTYSKKGKYNLRGDIFSPFEEICQGQALRVEKLT